MGFIGMYGPKGYGFLTVLAINGESILVIFVIDLHLVFNSIIIDKTINKGPYLGQL